FAGKIEQGTYDESKGAYKRWIQLFAGARSSREYEVIGCQESGWERDFRINCRYCLIYCSSKNDFTWFLVSALIWRSCDASNATA
ncbi:hypothetical protein KC19_9G074500, partial [Ceratodon purpureus]